MSWLALITAGILEIFGVIAMKKFILLIAVLFMISFSFLGIAMEEISMGTAYAIWTGIGAGGGVAVGILFFKESGNFKKIFFITLILASSIGLKIIS